MRYQMDEWIGFWIKRIDRDMTNLHDRKLADVSLTSSQVAVLALLWEKDGLSQKEMHEQLGIRAASLSNVLDLLVASGYVVRRQDQDDARVKRVYLTDTGKSVETVCVETVHDMEDILQQGFSKEELSLMLSWLKRVHSNVDKA